MRARPVVLLLVAAAVAAWLMWRRRDDEYARLVDEPDRPDLTPAPMPEPSHDPVTDDGDLPTGPAYPAPSTPAPMTAAVPASALPPTITNDLATGSATVGTAEASPTSFEVAAAPEAPALPETPTDETLLAEDPEPASSPEAPAFTMPPRPVVEDEPAAIDDSAPEAAAEDAVTATSIAEEPTPAVAEQLDSPEPESPAASSGFLSDRVDELVDELEIAEPEVAAFEVAEVAEVDESSLSDDEADPSGRVEASLELETEFPASLEPPALEASDDAPVAAAEPVEARSDVDEAEQAIDEPLAEAEHQLDEAAPTASSPVASVTSPWSPPSMTPSEAPSNLEDAIDEIVTGVQLDATAEQVDLEDEVGMIDEAVDAPIAEPAAELASDAAPSSERLDQVLLATTSADQVEAVAETVDDAVEDLVEQTADDLTEVKAALEDASADDSVEEELAETEPELDEPASRGIPPWPGTTNVESELVAADAPPPPTSDDRVAPRAPSQPARSGPPSNPSGAPFRSAGDQLPAQRSWPTLPR